MPLSRLALILCAVFAAAGVTIWVAMLVAGSVGLQAGYMLLPLLLAAAVLVRWRNR